jgi:hypothetical protein
MGLAATIASSALAKKVVCVDGAGDGFLNNAEGYHRATAKDGDTVVVGGSLKDCMDQVGEGDCLVIIAHGVEIEIENEDGSISIEYGFTWDGENYTGFGEGEGNMPVPEDFKDLKNVTVKLVGCWTSCPGADGRSLTDDIVRELGEGGTATGFPGVCEGGVYFTLKGGTDEERKKAAECLNNNDAWQGKPPSNRPNTGGAGQPPNQQSAAQAQLAGCAGTGDVKVCIEQQVGQREGPHGKPPCKSGYLEVVNVNGKADPNATYPERSIIGGEPWHSFVSIKSEDGAWVANIEDQAGGAGQCIDLVQSSLDFPNNDGVFEVLHYVSAGRNANRPLARVEKIFRLVSFSSTSSTYTAVLRAAHASVGNRALYLTIDGEMVPGDNGGLKVTLTYLNASPTPVTTFVRSAVYADLNVANSTYDDMVSIESFGVMQLDEGSPEIAYLGLLSLDAVTAGAKSFPQLMEMMDGGELLLEGEFPELPSDVTAAIVDRGTFLAPGESVCFSYFVGNIAGEPVTCGR